MNRIEKGKKQLIWLSIIVLVVSIGILAGGIALIVSGANAIVDADVLSIVLQIVGGSIMSMAGLVGVVLAIVMVWTGGSLRATRGNIAEDNSLAKGTINMEKCQKCGCETKNHKHTCECKKQK